MRLVLASMKIWSPEMQNQAFDMSDLNNEEYKTGKLKYKDNTMDENEP